jgi:SAM-dependent methyltransferase
MNPVEIKIEDRDVYIDHFKKRRNLYENKLHIPLNLLRDKTVLEFGCNSGENPLVLADMGAELTLVEPNEQVYPRLWELFERYGLTESISSLNQLKMLDFGTKKRFDLVIAEGFLHALPERREAFVHALSFLAAGGICVITNHDVFGNVIEFMKRAVMARACYFMGCEITSDAGYQIARDLFHEDFTKIPSSRSFQIYWEEGLCSPWMGHQSIWEFQDIVQIAAESGCGFYSSDPEYRNSAEITWYKDVPELEDITDHAITDYERRVSSFVLGRPLLDDADMTSASAAAIKGLVDEQVRSLASYFSLQGSKFPDVPRLGDVEKLSGKKIAPSASPLVQQFDALLDVLDRADAAEEVISAYTGSSELRSVWGTPLHYVAFIKNFPNDGRNMPGGRP